MPEKKLRNKSTDYENVAKIISDAGGQIVGRTRLQKVAYLLELTGLGSGFAFSYYRFGPYSEELNLASQMGSFFEVLVEEEKSTSWGGNVSIYSCKKKSTSSSLKRDFIKFASSADPVELELAATAAFLAIDGFANPWAETAKRKQEKSANGRLDRSRDLYSKLQEFQVPKRLPHIA